MRTTIGHQLDFPENSSRADISGRVTFAMEMYASVKLLGFGSQVADKH